MKKIIVAIAIFVSFAIPSTAKTMKYGKLLFKNLEWAEISGNVGTMYGEKKAISGLDISMGGFLLGFGFDNTTESFYAQGSKTVYVQGYDRVQNGKLVHVDSYYRSKPNSSGMITTTKVKMREWYVGYWFPYIYRNNIMICSAPIFGQNVHLSNDFVSKFMYGIGTKITYNYVGATIKITNTSATIGLMLRLK